MQKKERKLRSINSLFDRYKTTLKAPQKVVVDAFCEVVEDLFGVTLPPERVKYTAHSKTLAVGVSGALKSELKVREDEVLAHLKGRLGAANAPTSIL